MKNIRILSVIFIWVGTIILASFQGIFLMTYKTMPLDNTFFIFAQSVVAKISLLLNSTILSSQENIETLNFVVKHSELIGAVLFLIIFGLSLFFIVPLFSWSNIKKEVKNTGYNKFASYWTLILPIIFIMIEASFIVWFVLTPVDNFYYIGGLNPIFFINFIGPLFLLTGSIFWLVFLTDILKLNNRIQNSLNSKTSPHIVRDDYGVGEINHREQTRTSINFDDNSNIDLKQKVAKLKAMMGNAPDDNYLRTVDKDTREVVHENPSAAFIEKTNDIKEPVPTQPVTYKDKIDSVKVLDKEHKIFIPSSRKDTDFDTSSIAKKLNQNPLYGGSYNSQTKQSNYKNKTNNNNSSFVGDGDKIWEANQQYRNQYVSKEKVYKNNDDENRNN